MNPYRATARQKRGAISWTFRRAAASIHGTASVRTVRTNRRSCFLKEILHGDPGPLIGLLVIGGWRRAVFRHEPVGEGV